jgi:ribosomal protein S18 acetylase RimI-like enzyme
VTGFLSEALGKHDRSVFTSGNERIDSYFRQTVSQEIKRGYAACYVLVEQASAKIAGFYALSSHSVPITELAAGVARKLPRYPSIPAVLIGWLGRDLTFRGQHIGSMLLADAITRLAAAPVGVHAMCADAIDDAAAAFYREHQFQPFASRPNGFYLPLETALALVAKTRWPRQAESEQNTWRDPPVDARAKAMDLTDRCRTNVFLSVGSHRGEGGNLNRPVF